jgi:hypothetical protein
VGHYCPVVKSYTFHAGKQVLSEHQRTIGLNPSRQRAGPIRHRPHRCGCQFLLDLAGAAAQAAGPGARSAFDCRLPAGVSHIALHYSLGSTPLQVLDQTLQDIAQQHGAEILGPRLKSEERTTVKANQYAAAAGHTAPRYEKVTDVLAATLIADNIDKAHAIAAGPAAREDVVKIKNRYANPLESGYRDMLALYRMPNGALAEIQADDQGQGAVRRAHHVRDRAAIVSPQ